MDSTGDQQVAASRRGNLAYFVTGKIFQCWKIRYDL